MTLALLISLEPVVRGVKYSAEDIAVEIDADRRDEVVNAVKFVDLPGTVADLQARGREDDAEWTADECRAALVAALAAWERREAWDAADERGVWG